MSEEQSMPAEQQESNQQIEQNASDNQKENQTEKASETNAEKAKRVLANEDLDALVTVTIDGKKQEMSVREALRLTQLEKASREKFNQADKMEKQAKQFFQWAKQNPRDFLKETGIDPYEFAEATLAEKYEMMNLTDEQKEILELKRYKELNEKEKAELKKKQEDEEKSKEELIEREKLDKEIGEAWKESGLPADPYLGAMVAFQMMASSKQNKVLTAKEAASIVKTRYFEGAKSIIEKMDAQAIRDFFGDGIFKKIRQADLDKITAKAASKLGQKSQESGLGNKPTSNVRPEKSANEFEYRKKMDEIMSKYKD